jgi:hypothetical protein
VFANVALVVGSLRLIVQPVYPSQSMDDCGTSVTWARWLCALLELLRELLSGSRRLPRARLIASSRSVDRLRIASSRHVHGCTAFIDGAALSDGRCGVAIFYTAGHPLNTHAALDLPDGAPADSNLAELAALVHCLLRHPRHEPLIVFSDSEHALRCAEAVAAPEAVEGRVGRKTGTRRRRQGGGNGGVCLPGSNPLDPQGRCTPDPTRDARWGCVVLLIHLVLRLRRAPTALYKVWRLVPL